MKFPDYFADVCERLGIDPLQPLDGAGMDGAPWIVDPWLPVTAEGITFVVEPSAEGAHEWGQPIPLGGPMPIHGVTPDHLALYRPWHVAGPNWGIYINGDALPAYVAQVAGIAGHPPAVLAPFVLRTLIDHEVTHFAVEVGATLMEDATGMSLYREYVTQRYHHPTNMNIMPLEEAFATWREVRQRRFSGLGSTPDGLLTAIRETTVAMGPGYSDWHAWGMDQDRSRRELAGLVRGGPLTGGDWFGPAFLSGHPRDVPRYWVGNPALLPAFGALPRTVGQIQIRRLRTWLQRSLGATYCPNRGKGSHEWWETDDNRIVAFMDTRDGLLTHKDRRRITKALGMNQQEFYEAVMG